MTSTLLLFPQRQQRIPTTHASCRLPLWHSWTGETRKRTNHRWPLSTNCFFVFAFTTKSNDNNAKVLSYLFSLRSFCTATWCDHGEFNTLLLFICYLLFCFPVLSCYNILYLSCSNQLHTGWNVKRFSVYTLTSKFFSLYFCVIEMTVQFMTTQEVVVNEAGVQCFDPLLAYTKRLGIF